MLRFFLLLCGLLILQPASAVQPRPDPAVEYANKMKTGAIGYREGYFGSGDTRLHYVEAGSGPLIILYHGFPSNWFSWLDIMEQLKQEHHVVAVDGLGAGLSGKPNTLAPYRVDRLASQLDRFARSMGGHRKFILIGHDWGAALSLAYAQAYPNRLRAAVGMSAPPYNMFLDLVGKNEEQRQRSAYMQRFRDQSPQDVQKGGFAPRFAAQVYGGLRDAGHLTEIEARIFQDAVGDPAAMNGGMNWYRANLPPFEAIDDEWKWPKHDHQIKVPTLIIWGERDLTFLPVFLDQMEDYSTELKIVRLPGIGHMTPIEGSDLSAAAILDFIAAIK